MASSDPIGVERFLASAGSTLPASGRAVGGAPLLIPQNSDAACFGIQQTRAADPITD